MAGNRREEISVDSTAGDSTWHRYGGRLQEMAGNADVRN
jgi:hypothetical protein